MIQSFLRCVRIFSIGFFLSFIVACEVVDPPEQIPSYIHIDKIDLTTDYLTQGSNASKFTDAWVYVDDEPLGAYELPATIPVLKQGSHSVKIRGGIKMNGISATRSPYTLCNFHTQDVDFKVNSTIAFTPTVSYFPAIKFRWKDDFENAGVSLIASLTSDTSLQMTSNSTHVFEGRQSAVVYLDANHPYFECQSAASYNLPLGDVFLELNYKCNNTFSVGVYASNNPLPYTTLYIKPSDEWNKIYINLANEIGTANSNPYRIFIAMEKSADVELPTLYLDNIKLIHQ